MEPFSNNSDKTSVEYFDAPFDQVVNAAMAAVSDLGMYVEDRHRSGLDQTITVRSSMSGVSYDDLLTLTIEQPTVQGVAVTISRNGPERGGYSNDTESLLRQIALRLGR
jgi:hypothetical protein